MDNTRNKMVQLTGNYHVEFSDNDNQDSSVLIKEVLDKMDDKKTYFIIDEQGRYFCHNDFNGKASFLSPDAKGNPPSIAYEKQRFEAEKKINYLMNHTTHPGNEKISKRGTVTFQNSFTELKLIPKTKTDE